MAWLSENELARRRQDALKMLTDTVTLYHRTSSKGPYGYGSVTYDAGAQVQASVIGPSAGLLTTDAAEQIGASSTWQVHFAYGTVVGLGDKIVASGQTLIVQNDLTPRTAAVVTSVEAAAVKEGTP